MRKRSNIGEKSSDRSIASTEKLPNICIYQGDNLAILKHYIKNESIDLIYLDPPFNSMNSYRILKGGINSKRPTGGLPAFEDQWMWDNKTVQEFENTLDCNKGRIADTLDAFKLMLGETSILAYLTFITPRLAQLRRVLKSTGSIYLHCDRHANVHLRILMDAIFGQENYLNTIVWCYGLGGSSPRYWPRKHDDILWYSREPNKHHFEAVKIPATSMKMKGKLKKTPDYWLIPTINNMARERCGYPTQKPEALLERIIISSSREDDLVLDPFCGSGTTLYVAHKLGRSCIGIDESREAINITRKRLDLSN